MTFPRPSSLRGIAVPLLLGGILLALFLISRRGERQPETPDTAGLPAPEAAALLDDGIDEVLASFGIPAGSVTKREVEIAGAGYSGTERMVIIPDTVASVDVNAAMNTLARRFRARAVASENPRLRTVTIHLELDGAVVHTIVLKEAPPRPRTPRRSVIRT